MGTMIEQVEMVLMHIEVVGIVLEHVGDSVRGCGGRVRMMI